MVSKGIPVTRERYLALAFPQGAPDPLPAELEADLPPGLQKAPQGVLTSPPEEEEYDDESAVLPYWKTRAIYQRKPR